ncbi:MAG: hypothetical protein IPK33_10395 [Gemmatimonadetes bacterium]|nr:hypothetical protein [Gemmatimonadota bacterium]
MDTMFFALLELLRASLRDKRALKTDNSVLLIYPPERELEFREYLLDTLVPELEAKRIPHRLLDLTGFLFEGLTAEQVEDLQDEEFADYRWLRQGLSKRVESMLLARLKGEAVLIPGGNVLVYSTVALYPLVRFGEVLRELRDLDARIILAFPGEDRGGKLHFMSQADGANYLALKLFARRDAA